MSETKSPKRTTSSAPPKRTRKSTAKDLVAMPASFVAALAQDVEAKALFESMPPSHQREYVAYILEAKRDSTRERRAVLAVAMIRKWGEQQRRDARQ